MPRFRSLLRLIVMAAMASHVSCGNGEEIPTSPAPPVVASPTPPTAPETVARYMLDGYVRDLNTRLGIRAASVEIRTTGGVSVLQVNTDDDGHFIFLGGVDAGDYFFVFTASGYEQHVMTLSHRSNVSWDISLRRSAPGAAASFTEIDRLSSEMVRTGAPSDAVELIVIDQDDQIVQRPGAH